MEYRTNYTRGYVVSYEEVCFDSWLLIPAEILWNEILRGFLYLLGMAYIFVGIAIVADIFVSSIEVITSKKKTVTRYDPEKEETFETEVFVWNETVANLTLMALGSSAPEILLAIIETVTNLDDLDCTGTQCDGLGPFTIIGSAAFNLLLISAICIVSVPSHTSKRISEFGVFLLTSVWSMFAYIWLLVVLEWISPGEVETWEACTTLAFFPLLVITAWAQDKGWWIKTRRVTTTPATAVEPSRQAIRVLGIHENRHSVVSHRSMELSALEAVHRRSVTGPEISTLDLKDVRRRKQKIREVVSYWKGFQPDDNNAAEHVAEVLQNVQDESNLNNRTVVRARFRHAALRCITGGRAKKVSRTTLGSAVSTATTTTTLSVHNQPKLLNLVNSLRQSMKSIDNVDPPKAGSFAFVSPTYSVLKSSRHIRVYVSLSWRKKKSKRWQKLTESVTNPYHPNAVINDATIHSVGLNKRSTSIHIPPEILQTVTDRDSDSNHSDEDENDNDSSLPSRLCVEYETRDGTALKGRDYQYKSGRLTFHQNETKKDIDVPITMEQYSTNHDFYVVLKNPSSEADLLDPVITRVTIIDDDEPGMFYFEQASYHANIVTESVTVTVVRDKGCDGNVSVLCQTINGTARGGTAAELKEKSCDFENVQNKTLDFAHGETRKQVDINVNLQSQNKNFILLLKEPSPGTKIGEISAAVLHISSDIDDIVDRVANIMVSQEEVSISTLWATQFEEAMNVASGEDEDGAEVKPGASMFILHFLTFFWKVLFAFIPPRTMWGGWPAFGISLGFIALLTAVIEQLGKLLGCVLNIKNSVAGVTIIAIGTSLPDTFASRTAAMQDTFADAAIGNITGSNSVNVFLGLGIPWVISAFYMMSQGKTYKVSTSNLTFSVVVFVSTGTLALCVLVVRRKFARGELGGPRAIKVLSTFLLLFLWVTYVVLVSLVAYDVITVSL